jgi:hypothetical protein
MPRRTNGRSGGARRQSSRGAGSSQTTTDHETIQRWAEERDGQPATVVGTARDEEAGILRLDFPGYSGKGDLEPISWEEWFEKFDANELAFLYQEKMRGGQESRFFKLVKRNENGR